MWILVAKLMVTKSKKYQGKIYLFKLDPNARVWIYFSLPQFFALIIYPLVFNIQVSSEHNRNFPEVKRMDLNLWTLLLFKFKNTSPVLIISIYMCKYEEASFTGSSNLAAETIYFIAISRHIITPGFMLKY